MRGIAHRQESCMSSLSLRLACLSLLGAALSLPVHAASSTASSASDSVGASVGSISGSIQRSSNSSTTTAVAEGDYKIIEMATVADRPGQQRLTLRAVAGPAVQQADNEFFLFVPDAAVAQGRLATGHVVSARPRPYGIEFAQAESREAFFLVLSDSWYRELQTTPVVL
jgi:hypothetical protein